ncbi:MAG: SDR family NAD(P)-dependent oxidoreductase [Chitinophagaceae bacterium]|nr:MAG: SDR family NAD(P)-dependent oxidoreductase [Chitinophagaceae bacterium]
MNIVITGASRGIGFAIAQKFAAHGYDLIITSMNEDSIIKALNQLKNEFPNIKIYAAAYDLSIKAKAIAFGQWVQSIGGTQVLVNNAGTYLPGKITDIEGDILEQQISTNLMSAFYVTKEILPVLQKTEKSHIFNICSIAALKAYENGGAYSVSKYALKGFNDNLRLELMPMGIKVTGVYPGAVLTDSWAGFDNTNHRIMEAKDIADMIFQATQLSTAACVEEIIIRPVLGDL